MLCGFFKGLGGCDLMFVCEYMFNGFVFDVFFSDSIFLWWFWRYSIVYGVVVGLEYFYEYCRLLIIYGNLKFSNILLDWYEFFVL